MKRLFTFLGTITFMVGSAIAQEVNSSVPMSEPTFGEDRNAQHVVDYTPLISIDSRFGYDRVVSGGPAGFGGDGIYLNIEGKISKNLSYSLCQRFFSSHGEDDSAFDNTDWLTLS